mmetsp:Transcript_65305/g.116036  ORF Transcript_65305/g.116036 Transcript_65305/m.116036 type:complete len:255 (+) Transcript_65305:230-994(+)
MRPANGPPLRLHEQLHWLQKPRAHDSSLLIRGRGLELLRIALLLGSDDAIPSPGAGIPEGLLPPGLRALLGVACRAAWLGLCVRRASHCGGGSICTWRTSCAASHLLGLSVGTCIVRCYSSWRSYAGAVCCECHRTGASLSLEGGRGNHTWCGMSSGSRLLLAGLVGEFAASAWTQVVLAVAVASPWLTGCGRGCGTETQFEQHRRVAGGDPACTGKRWQAAARGERHLRWALGCQRHRRMAMCRSRLCNSCET